MNDRVPLLARWRTHVQMLGNFSADLVGRTFDNLCASYSEPHRRYHTLNHLTALFDCLEVHGEEIGDPARLAFAAWYHDVVYDPRRTDNEAKSAERAMKELDALGAGSDLRSHVVQLILATKNHTAGGRDYDDDIFLDADFAILGVPEDAYRQYVRDVRAEYAHVDDAGWKSGRSAFLKKTAAAPRIFRTGIFEGEYAEQARTNIAWELSALEGGERPAPIALAGTTTRSFRARHAMRIAFRNAKFYICSHRQSHRREPPRDARFRLAKRIPNARPFNLAAPVTCDGTVTPT